MAISSKRRRTISVETAVRDVPTTPTARIRFAKSERARTERRRDSPFARLVKNRSPPPASTGLERANVGTRRSARHARIKIERREDILRGTMSKPLPRSNAGRACFVVRTPFSTGETTTARNVGGELRGSEDLSTGERTGAVPGQSADTAASLDTLWIYWSCTTRGRRWERWGGCVVAGARRAPSRFRTRPIGPLWRVSTKTPNPSTLRHFW